MTMEFKQRTALINARLVTKVMLVTLLCVTITTVSADTYRWKDKEGNVHYGAAVPAEYADQPYDVLNSAGMVIERIEDTSIRLDVLEQEKEEKKGRQPLISEEERQIQADRLLLVQYRSEDEIIKALELEIAQLGYDSRIIEQSYESTSKAIRDQIKRAGDQQRANIAVSKEQQKELDGLYARRANDEKRRASMRQREERIRARSNRNLERYRFLTAEQLDADADAETGNDAETSNDEAEQG